MKIKCIPEDFLVEEIAELPLKKTADYSVYLLTKQGFSTVELLRKIARKLNIPYAQFAYGGRKDKQGITSQYISIKNPAQFNLKEENYSLKFIAFIDRAMGPDMIKENKFQITVRNLNTNQIKNALKEIANIQETGYPNYFDDQRFGSFDKNQGFFAEKILKGHFNGALKIHLTRNNNFFLEHWKDWKICLKHAETKFEKDAFSFLSLHPNKSLPIIKLISKDELTIYFSAFQSYLWNEVLRRIIYAKAAPPFKTYKGVAGDYLFYTNLEKETFEYLKNLELPAPSAKTKMPDEFTQAIYDEVLQQNGLTQNLFKKIKLRQAFFKPTPRQAIVIPQKIDQNSLKDKLYKDKMALSLKFSLRRGNFATMLVKRLFPLLFPSQP
ncbi:MAG: tRNA pseudouridine(13) synthase TruD [Candidatus Omnitrophica bacterium]|nr:tRNA pseudouridine(13) synthase TruD [Candidatus Omnitrophota bacterium]